MKDSSMRIGHALETEISMDSLSLETPPDQGPLVSGKPVGQQGFSTQQPSNDAMGVPDQWEEPADLVALVSLILHHDVPHIDLDPSTGLEPHSWQQKNMYVSYSLGEGASSFLELHAMRSEVTLNGQRFEKGSRVALKRSFVDRFDDDVGVTPEQFDFFRRELRVFCHPGLCSHENICNLLFIGWEEHSPAPVLGLELADYGTLKELLWEADLRAHESLASHLVLDVGLGLRALHRVGLIHGDVKTGNILVFAHPRRKAVAKLADFSDSISLIESQSKWTSVRGTHSWRAPECYGNQEYDLNKTDIYSFGLCALAILAQGIQHKNANSTSIGDCFLIRLGELEGRSKADVQNEVTKWKCSEDNLVLERAEAWADVYGNDDFSKKNSRLIVSTSLRREPQKREDMDAIVTGQLELLKTLGEPESCNRVNEHLLFRDIQDGQLEDSCKKERCSELRMVSSLSHPSLRDRHPFFKRRLFQSLKKLGSPALDIKFSTVEDILQNPFKLTFSKLLAAAARGSIPLNPNDVHPNVIARSLEAAAQVAECYSTGFGVHRDLYHARKWLAVAARSGRLDHAIYFSVIDNVLSDPELHDPDTALRELWVVLTAAGGCAETAKILRTKNTGLYWAVRLFEKRSMALLRRLEQSEELASRIADQMDAENLPVDNRFPSSGYPNLHSAVVFGTYEAVKAILDEGATVDSVDFAGYTPLMLAAEGGKTAIVKLLLDRGADPGLRSTIGGTTALHFLCFCDNEPASSLARQMVQSPEQLDVVSSQRRTVGTESPFQRLRGSPLQWAASKPQEQLFSELLKLHRSFARMPSDWKDILEILSSTHQHGMLAQLISSIPDMRVDGDTLSPSELDTLLLKSVQEASGMLQIMMHGKAFEEAEMKTIDVLLHAGADPFRRISSQLNHSDGVLQDAIIADDLPAFKKFVAYGEQKKIDLRSVFANESQFGGRNAFQRSIYCSSWRIFHYLSRTPYIDIQYRSPRGMTALHAAAVTDDPRFIDVLLNLGYDPYARSADGRTPFQSAIFFKAFNSASRLLQSDACMPRRLFSATPEAVNRDGFTLFGSVLSAALTNYRHAVNFTSIRYLESVGAFTFRCNIFSDSTVLDLMASLWPATRPDYAAFDRFLLEYLVSRAPHGALNRHDECGLTPLHWFVMRGNLSAITTLLTHPSCQSEINVNIETIDARPTTFDGQPNPIGSNPGKTPLDLALLRRRHHHFPEMVRKGGAREIREWPSRINAIIKTLRDAGAVPGRGSSQMDLLDAEGAVDVVHPGNNMLQNIFKLILGHRYWPASGAQTGPWPRRLGSSQDEDCPGQTYR